MKDLTAYQLRYTNIDNEVELLGVMPLCDTHRDYYGRAGIDLKPLTVCTKGSACPVCQLETETKEAQ